jgi:hypothetical protein
MRSGKKEKRKKKEGLHFKI